MRGAVRGRWLAPRDPGWPDEPGAVVSRPRRARRHEHVCAVAGYGRQEPGGTCGIGIRQQSAASRYLRPVRP
jgi:hypothetical protein